MLKKFVYTLAAAAMTFGFAACSSDEPLAGAAGQDGLVTFTAQLPAELASRAFGEGENAKKLTVYVYEKDVKTTLIETKTAEFPADDLTTTVELQLVNGKAYDILFWADAYGENGADTPFSYNASTQTVKVDYTKMASNEDKGDAFFFAEKGLEVKGAINKTIYLTRPFAQINFGTDDLGAAAVVNAFGITADNKFGTVMSKLALTAAMPDQLNLFDGTVTTTDGAAATAFAAVTPTDDDTFPYGTGYDYMSMSYVLVGADRDVVDLKYTVLNGDAEYNTLEIAAVPVQRNYRTNIYGSLLTSKVNFTVEIDNEFIGGENIPLPWDGKSKSEVKPVVKTIDGADVTVMPVKTAAEYAWIVDQVNGKKDGASDLNIYLEDDINLGGKTIMPIGLSDAADFTDAEGAIFGQSKYTGSVYGNGHTIENAVINVTHHGSALIHQVRGANSVVSDLHAKNITFKIPANRSLVKWVGGLIGYVNAGTSDKVTIKDCSVENVKIESATAGFFTAGGLIGYISSVNCDVVNCKVDNVIINGVGSNHCSVSPLIGKIYMGKNINITNCKVSNSTTYYVDDIANISLDEGCGDGVYIGSIFNYGNGADMKINITGCSYTNWKDIATQDNNADISGRTFDSNKLYPYIGGFDSYKSNGSSSIMLDGAPLFPFN